MGAATNIPISATTTGFIVAINNAEQATRSFTGALNNSLKQAFTAVDRQTRLFEAGIGRVGDKLKSVGTGMSTYVTAPILAAGAAMFRTYANIDALQRALGAVATKIDPVSAQFSRLRDIARLPGVGLEEAVQGSVRLQAVGFSAKAAEAAIRQFGNAIALTGGGKAELSTITTQLGQMAAKGKVLAQDLKPVIEAAPAAAGVIKRLFNTVDSEEISAKLKAQGKDSAYFIDLLTNELGKLERVEGGPKNAIENLGDSLKVASFNFIKVADNALGLTTILNGIGDFITKTADSFAGLSPATQTAILALTGVAAAIGPISLAVGGIITLLPTLAAGFAAITGPVGIAVAAVVAAGILIAKNWDSVKSVLTDTGIWDAVSTAIDAGIGTIKSVFSAGVTFIIAVWDQLKDIIIPTTRFLFDIVVGIFKAGAGVLTGVFKVLTGILTLSWSTFTEGLQNITASIVNVIKTTFLNTFVYLGRLFAEFLKRGLGQEGNAYFLNQYLDGVQVNASKAAIALKGAKSAASDLAGTKAIELAAVTVTGKRTATTNFAGKAGAQGSDAEKEFTKLDTLKRTAASLEQQIQSLDRVAPQKLFEQLSAVRQEIERIESLTKGSSVKLGNLSLLQPKQSTPESVQLPGVDSLLKRLQEPTQRIKENLQQLNDDINSTLQQAAQSALVGMGTLIGNLIAGVGSLSDIPKMLGGIFANLAKTMGQALIAFGTAGLALKAFKTNPVTAIVAGIALIALGTALEASLSRQAAGAGIKAYAKGGVFTQETIGRFGEYPGADRNPEIATPQSILRSTFQQELSRVPFDRLQSSAQAQRSTPKEMYVNLDGLVVRGSDLELSRKRYLAKVSDYNA